ncbi:efflux RND transporter periplasmic adaptor subunit [Salinimonas marina]|uniref:Efflux RND transporter periplasmic adaptor subunit n=1 Tax=Salinimonas marina TaxID=2785918 RepID=A0A7S9DV65_9ALTE|nr:efflux RND transporter periplasmic adaptor subunit [Salinimonas marina]QPG04427.1 efflux RND transporter periplasmic adaptor subunit [Salinimonas marina]
MKNAVWTKAGIPLVIVLVAIVLAVVLVKSKQPPPTEPVETKAFLVDAEPVSRTAVTFTVSSQGNVIPNHRTNLSAQVSGKVVDISDNFVAGGMFDKGEVLVTLESDDYQTEISLAEAQLAQAQAALTEEMARGEVAKTEWQSVNSGIPPELGLRKPQLAREQANVKAAQARLERARRNLQRTEIRAPYNGLVVSRDIDIGQFVGLGSTVGTLYSTDIAEIRLPVADSDMAFIDLDQGIGRKHNVLLKARVNGMSQQWRASLVRSEGVLDEASRVSYLVARLPDPYQRNSEGGQPLLRFGQFVEAEITTGKQRDLFVLPRSVLRLDQTILTVNDDNEIQIKPVEVARTNASQVFIADGLENGERVVLSAVPNPYNGMQVRLPGDEPQPPEIDEDTPDETEQVKVGG